ncbi:MAG: glycosyltransferase family 4 protein [Gemmatimonadales bacterium]
MRIIFLTHNFPRWPGDVSGAFLASLAAALIDRGHEVRVLAPSDEGKIGRLKYEGIPVRRVRYTSPERETLAYRGTMQSAVRTPRGFVTFVRMVRALRKAAREEMDQADVLHAHWWVPAGLAAPPESRYVLTMHGTDGMLLTRSAAARALARPIIHRAKVVTTVSTALAAIVKARAGKEIIPHKIQPMPADASAFRPGDPEATGLVTVARLTQQKRVDLAIRTVAILKQLGRRSTLTVIGDGPEREALVALSRELEVEDRVQFAGVVAPRDLGTMLSDKAVMLFPAVGEGFGLVAAEAFMSGVSVVACRDGGGVLDVVPPNRGGRIVDPNPEAMASAATELLDDPQRHREAIGLGDEWRRRLEPSVVAAQCEEWYYEALRAP